MLVVQERRRGTAQMQPDRRVYINWDEGHFLHVGKRNPVGGQEPRSALRRKETRRNVRGGTRTLSHRSRSVTTRLILASM